MGKKNLGKLIPKKKTVTDKKTGDTYERTYYLKPDEPDLAKDTKQEDDAVTPGTGGKKADTQKGNEKRNPDGTLRTKKDGEVDGKTAGEKGDGNALRTKTKDKNSIDIKKIKDFDDFGKQGIDPDVAQQMFCNM